MRQLDADLWVVDRPQRFYGLEVGTRMTVIRLADGSLLLHSPVALDAGLREGLEGLGACASRWRRTGCITCTRERSRRRIRDAALDRARAREEAPDLVFEGILGDEAPAEWRGQVDQAFFRRRPCEHEVVGWDKPLGHAQRVFRSESAAAQSFTNALNLSSRPRSSLTQRRGRTWQDRWQASGRWRHGLGGVCDHPAS